MTDETPVPQPAEPVSTPPLEAQVAILNTRLMVVEGQRNEAHNREVVLVADNAMLKARVAQLEALVAKLSAPKSDQSATDAPVRQPRTRRKG